jgi:hypothetical protein
MGSWLSGGLSKSRDNPVMSCIETLVEHNIELKH